MKNFIVIGYQRTASGSLSSFINMSKSMVHLKEHLVHLLRDNEVEEKIKKSFTKQEEYLKQFADHMAKEKGITDYSFGFDYFPHSRR